MDQFDRYAVAALPALGVAVAEGDLEILRLVDGAFAPVIAALDAIDLREIEPERGLDPSRAP